MKYTVALSKTSVFLEENKIVYLICINWENLSNSYQHSVLCTCIYIITM